MSRMRFSVLAGAAVSVLLAGCGLQDGAATRAETPAGSSPAAPEASESSESMAPSESARPSVPAVEPAQGTLLAVERLSVRLPEDWAESEPVVPVPNMKEARSADETGLLSILSPPYFVGDGLDRDGLLANLRRDRFRVLEPVELDGGTFEHGLRRYRSDGTVQERFVAVVDGYQVAISFFYDASLSAAERARTTGAVLATVDLA
jgi:hypothetical protein